MTKKVKESWRAALEQAGTALNELLEYQSDLQAEYEEWSEKKQESEKGQAACSINEADIQGWIDTLNEIDGSLDEL